MRLKLIMLLLAVYGLNIGYTQAQNGRFPLMPGATLVPGTKYFSESGNHYVVFSAGSDGNLCIWSADGNFLWGSVQYGTPSGGNRAVFQADGNFVINKNSNVVWASNSKDGKKMTLDGKGQLLITDANNNTLWKANPGSAVSLFCDPNFGGSYLQLDADGPDGGSFGTIQAGFINFDNLTSSIRVAKGYKVELYVDKVFQNPANKLILFEGDYKSLGKWNDQISAVKIYSVPEGTPVVKFYDDWWGGLQQNLGPGKYDTNNLLDDNLFTTMDVPSGASIMVYPNSGFSGVGNSEPIKKKVSTTATYEAVDLKTTYNLNDMISSIEIARPYYVLDKTVITNQRTLDGGTNEIVGIKMTGTNNTPSTTKITPRITQVYHDETRTAWSNATEIGVITTASASVSATPFPGVEARASVSATASLINTTTFSGDKTTSTDLTYDGQVEADIPPYKSYEVFLTAKMVTMQYDVVCTYVQIDSVNGQQVKRPGATYTNTATVTIKNAAELNATVQVVGDAGTGTTTGTSAPADNSNRQISMDGSSNYITLGNIGNVNDWTIELWFKTNSPLNYENLFHSNDLGRNEGVRLELSATGSAGKLSVSVAGTNNHLPATIVSLTEDLSADWHHLAIVGSKSQGKLLVYLDGVKKVDKAHTSWPTSFPNFVLGRGFTNEAARNYNGLMDEVRIWSIARNAGDIQATKSSLTGNETNLLAHYNFNQGIPGGDNRSTPTLLAKKGPNGTMTGFTLTGSTSNFIKQ